MLCYNAMFSWLVAVCFLCLSVCNFNYPKIPLCYLSKFQIFSHSQELLKGILVRCVLSMCWKFHFAFRISLLRSSYTRIAVVNASILRWRRSMLLTITIHQFFFNFLFFVCNHSSNFALLEWGFCCSAMSVKQCNHYKKIL